MLRILDGRLIGVAMENGRNNSTPFFVELLCQKYRCTPLTVSEGEVHKNSYSEKTIESSSIVSYKYIVSGKEDGKSD